MDLFVSSYTICLITKKNNICKISFAINNMFLPLALHAFICRLQNDFAEGIMIIVVCIKLWQQFFFYQVWMLVGFYFVSNLTEKMASEPLTDVNG